MRLAAKRDATEPDIVAALERAGCLVLRLDKFDLLVFRAGRLWMFDCKSPGGRPTLAQERLGAKGWPLYFVQTPEDALRLMGL